MENQQENINLQNKLKEIQDFVDNLQFEKAERLLLKLIDLVNSSEELKQELEQQQQYQEQFIYFKEHVISTMNNARYQLEQLNDSQNWESHKTKSNILISYKLCKQTSTVSIKAEAELNIPWFNLVSIIYEIDLFQKWFPFCKQSKTLLQPSKGQKIAYFEIQLPFISNRDAYAEGMGIDRLDEDGTLLIKCQSIQNNKRLMDKINIDLSKSKNVQVDLNYFACEIFPIPGEEQRVRVKTISNVNPKVSYVPQWMLNTFSKKFGTYLMEKLFDLSRNIKGTEWEKALTHPDNIEFYQWVKKRVDEYNEQQKLKIQNKQVQEQEKEKERIQ